LSSIAGRALRAVPRDLEGVFPPVFIALFFFIVNIATLSKLTQSAGLDRLLMTPIRRLAILLGHMVADVTVAMALTVPILTVGFAIGLRFETGVLGLLAFVVLAALWSLAFSGFGYAIALKTGNPAAVNSTFLLFFPVLVPHVVVRASLAAVGLARHRCRTEPCHVLARGSALARQPRLAVGSARQVAARDPVAGCDQHVDVLRRAARADEARLI
jgi:hypothetical protein